MADGDVLHIGGSATEVDAGQPAAWLGGAAAEGVVREVREAPLSPTIEEAVGAYRTVGRRSPFLWRWVVRGLEVTTLSSVDEELRQHVLDTKTLGVMFDVLLDDVADAGPEPVLLERLLSIMSPGEVSRDGLNPDEREYLDVAEHVWRLIRQRLCDYPLYADLRKVLRFDYAQLANAMRYSSLINERPWMINLAEHDAYLPHNMHMMISATMDLMASSTFDRNELGHLREIVSYAQHMGRIGNLVTTWERELGDWDFSSGVFAAALDEGVLSAEDLASRDRDLIRDSVHEADAESFFLRRWSEYRNRILARTDSVRSVDVRQLVRGLEQLIRLHLGSRGLK